MTEQDKASKEGLVDWLFYGSRPRPEYFQGTAPVGQDRAGEDVLRVPDDPAKIAAVADTPRSDIEAFADSHALIRELEFIAERRFAYGQTSDGNESSEPAPASFDLGTRMQHLTEAFRTRDPKQDDVAGASAPVPDMEEPPPPEPEKSRTPRLFGLAFSGGGIRSAVFCLGIMQKLAAEGILSKADYLSTVSGGGYIGSALAWWLHGRTSVDDDPASKGYDTGSNLPFGTTDPADIGAPSDPPLSHLRRNGRYLIPGGGIRLTSGLAVVLRAILLNLLVWIPVSASLFLALNWIGENLTPSADLLQAGSATSSYQIILFVAAAIAGFFVVASVHYSFLAWTNRTDPSAGSRTHVSNVGPPASAPSARGASPGFAASYLSRSLALRMARFLKRYWKAILLVVLNLAFIGVLAAGFYGVATNCITADTQASEILGKCFATGGTGSPRYLGTMEWIGQNLWPALAVLAAAVLSAFLLPGHIFAAIAAIAAVVLALVLEGLVPKFVMLIAIAATMAMMSYHLGIEIRRSVQDKGVSERYSGRRAFEKLFGSLFIAVFFLVVLGSIPFVYKLLDETGMAELAGVASTAGGIASAVWGFIQSNGKGRRGAFTTYVLAVGALLLVYGILLLGYGWNLSVFSPDQTPDAPGDKLREALFWLALLMAVISGWFTNLNYISLGRFYRDRLMEAFLPNYETALGSNPAPAGLADRLLLSELWRGTDKSDATAPKGPFPLINTNLVLVNSPNAKFRNRGGDNFVLSPFFCGSNATGWVTTESFDNNQMSLASAMSISGAAANPRGGVGGKGVTTNRAVSLVMTLLNFRLGYWVNRPRESRLSRFWPRPNHFYPSAVYCLPNTGYQESSDFLELSDGGHFENLAIYELVRRRCGLIVVCDGGQDTESSYADFVTAIQRIGQDFGATIDLVPDKGPELLVPRKEDDVYPKGVDYARKGFFVARINYGARGGHGLWPQRGVIIYMKTAMIAELSMTAKGYKGANPDFPDQTTGDQFFDEEQFEAYREVGYRIAEQMLGETMLKDRLSSGCTASMLDTWLGEIDADIVGAP